MQALAAVSFRQKGGGRVPKLTERQKRFVDEYLVSLNATDAARKAGYSVKNADRIGPELLGKPWVYAAIQAKIKERRERTEITQDYVLKQLKEIADMPAADYSESWLKYANKIRALELLGKHVGAFERQDGDADKVSPLLRDIADAIKRRNE